MTAEDVTPVPADDDRPAGEAGVGAHQPAPASPSRVTFDELESLIYRVVDVARHDMRSTVKADADRLFGLIPMLLDAVYSAYEYRCRAHQPIQGEPEYLRITTWIRAEIAACADNVVRWVTL
jgi:hypothetical protein